MPKKNFFWTGFCVLEFYKLSYNNCVDLQKSKFITLYVNQYISVVFLTFIHPSPPLLLLHPHSSALVPSLALVPVSLPLPPRPLLLSPLSFSSPPPCFSSLFFFCPPPPLLPSPSTPPPPLLPFPFLSHSSILWPFPAYI